MIKALFGAATLAIMAAASPASAQLLGGGGLGGTIGGTLGGIGGAGNGSLGGMLGSTVDRLPSTDADGITRTRGSARASKKIDARKGNVSTSGSTDNDGLVDSAATIGGRSLTGSGSASGNAGGGLDAQLAGTDDLRNAVTGAAGHTRNLTGAAVDRTRTATGNAVSGARNAVPSLGGGAGGSGSASGSGNGGLSLPAGNLDGAGNLALAGSSAADAGAFPISPGMIVTNARGRAIGTVQSVRSTTQGAVQQVLVRVGNKVAELPAANFTGSGSVLVSAMARAM